MSGAGDVNGDGLADLIVGAYQSDPTSGTDAGRSYVVFGKSTGTAIDLSAVATGTSTLGFVINGQTSLSNSGIFVSGAGDVNGDGLADLIVGTNGRGSYVVFGKSTGTAIDLSAIAAGTGGYVINGECTSDSAGLVVSAAGDVNGDGFADVLVTSPQFTAAAGSASGRSYVVFGKNTTTAINLSDVASGTGTSGFVINGASLGDKSAFALSAAGDMNGDGLADVVVTSRYAATLGGYNGGRSYVVFGKTTATAIDLSAVAAGTGGFVFDGIVGDYSGNSVSAGDVNGDGLADLVVGTNGKGSYVVFGSTTGVFAKTAVDQVGTSSADTLTSTSTLGGGQTLVGGAGDDILISGNGADVLYGGSGNDTFVVTSAMVAALQNTFGSGGNTTQLARIDGGTGIDTLRLSGGANLDLTAVSNAGSTGGLGLSRIASVEVIDMATDTKGNTTTLALKDVLDMAGMNVFNSTNTGSSSGTGLASSVAMHQLMIWGTAADSVNIGVSNWTQSTTNTAITFTDINNTMHTMTAFTFNSSSVFAQLLIENSIVNAVGHVT